MFGMNLYDLKVVHCYKCEKYVGEIRYDAEISMPICGNCAKVLSKIIEIPEYSASKYHKHLINAIPA
ncbi:MAG: hypothetical protein EB149_02695 [Thaumarchaeota archaeon]|nr:hypothetical protein [Nitrososphaerota archaeon]